jgi:hypothetical protein
MSAGSLENRCIDLPGRAATRETSKGRLTRRQLTAVGAYGGPLRAEATPQHLTAGMVRSHFGSRKDALRAADLR